MCAREIAIFRAEKCCSIEKNIFDPKQIYFRPKKNIFDQKNMLDQKNYFPPNKEIFFGIKKRYFRPKKLFSTKKNIFDKNNFGKKIRPKKNMFQYLSVDFQNIRIVSCDMLIKTMVVSAAAESGTPAADGAHPA